MASVNFYPLFRDFFSPLGIAVTVLLAGNFFYYKRREDSAKEESQRKRAGLVDALSINFDKLLSFLEILSSDAENKKYFDFGNIKKAESVVRRLQSLIDDVLIFSDEALRRKILENIDAGISLIDDISNLETYLTNEANQFSDKEISSLEKLRGFKLQLLKMNLKLGPGSKVESLDPKSKNEGFIQVANEIYEDLDRDYVFAKTNLADRTKYCTDKRVFLTMRIIDVQAKIRDLIKEITVLRLE